MENFILKINCGICETPVITNTIDRNYYCLDGCPMEKIEEIQKQYDLQWIKEHGNNTITKIKDNNGKINEIKQDKDRVSGFQSYGLPQDEVTSRTGTDREISTADTSSTWLANSCHMTSGDGAQNCFQSSPVRKWLITGTIR